MTLAQELDKVIPANVRSFNIVCVGTDRSTGDSLGPMVGLMLQQRGIPHVYGTLHQPVHAVNLAEGVLDTIPKRWTLGIDACLGQSSNIGKVNVMPEPLKPGTGVHKHLPPVGDAHIRGIVNVGGFMEYFVLQNTRLSLVYDMASEIASAVEVVVRKRQGVIPMKINKQQATAQFREMYGDYTSAPKKLKDKPMLHLLWNDYVNGLHKDNMISTYQAATWTNPFVKSERG